MALIYKTTMTPGKLELLTAWLPAQPWYVRTHREPTLDRAGGFRLDDPQGEVGMEFMVVGDGSGDHPVFYHVPLTYRGAPLDGADHALIGTSEHGVLGRRWVYDGVHDPVLAGQLLELLRGRAVPQAQSLSDTPDLSVVVRAADETRLPAEVESWPWSVTDGEHGTDLVAETAAAGESWSGRGRRLVVDVVRVLRPEPQDASVPAAPAAPAATAAAAPAGATGADHAPAGAANAARVLAEVTAGWSLPGGPESRGRFVTLREDLS